MNVTVVGAGVAGLTVATELVERGCKVQVIDQAEAFGRDTCSWYAGGMLAPWCEGDTAEEPVVRLGQEAIGWWRERVPDVIEKGSLVVAPSRDSGELARFARRTQTHQTIDAAGLAELEPGLEGRFRQALFFDREAHLDPRKAIAALIARLTGSGVTITYGKAVEDHKISGSVVVDTRGFAARDVLRDLRGVKGEMLMLKAREVEFSRPVRLLHPRLPVYLVPRGEGHFMVGATQIEAEDRGRITARGMVDLLNAAYAVHPAFAEAEIIETGADVRPAFPDNLPRLRWHGRTLHVNGLFRHGFLLAPACARMAAEAIDSPDYKPELMDEDHRERSIA
ncbi:MAG: glycine oxidase ThiO [Anderseniella sp.]|nr:glycine oxidase ThiO [Anderseniella sp.]